MLNYVKIVLDNSSFLQKEFCLQLRGIYRWTRLSCKENFMAGRRREGKIQKFNIKSFWLCASLLRYSEIQRISKKSLQKSLKHMCGFNEWWFGRIFPNQPQKTWKISHRKPIYWIFTEFLLFHIAFPQSKVVN